MASVASGTISFNVKAAVCRGEQVFVCGDAAFLGGWETEKALPLYTTPTDYPLWKSNEDVPMPRGDRTGYRYCVFRGGKFCRWETVPKPRIIRPSTTSQILVDVLDEEGKESSGNFSIRTTPESTPVPPSEEQGAHLDSGSSSSGSSTPDGDASCIQHRRSWEAPEPSTDGNDQAECRLDLSTDPFPESSSVLRAAENTQQATMSVTSSAGWEGKPERVGEVLATVTAATPSLETPSFAAARAAASAAACLEASAVPGHVEDGSPTSSLRRALAQEQEEAVESFIGERPGVRLRRPPSLEAEEGDGGGLGLGLRLGADAMTSPPPRLESSKGSPHVWSPRAGGVVVASYYLPVTLHKSEEGAWTAEWDREQLLSLQPTNLRVVRVGTVRFRDAEIPEQDKPAVIKALSKLNCVPVFLTASVAHRCYNQYCKGILWPVMHSILEMYDDVPDTLLDHKAIAEGWQAYKQVNRAFREKVVEVYHEGDMIWVHGFHLAILPAFLERTVKVARIGLFLHTPFPPSEVFRALPQREELLRGMLSADQVGFHRFIDGRHFIAACRRLLGLQHFYNPEGGLLQIVHGGKPVILSSYHAGVEPDAVRAALAEPTAQEEAERLKALHGGRTVLAGVEKVERLKGVWLKMLAFENMLKVNPELVGRVSMHEVGVTNQARGSDYRACRQLVSSLAHRINATHGEGTVVYEEREERDIDLLRRVALMSVSSVFVKTPVHDGLSTTAMEYRIVQEHKVKNNAPEKSMGAPGSIPGVLILSEAVSCSQALRGALTVNPWKVEAVCEAMAQAVTASDWEKTCWHEEDIEWCESRTTASWAEGVLADLSTVPKENRTRYATTGLGLTSRMVGTDPTFKRLSTDEARKAYSSSNSRVLFLDYGGTLVKDDTHTSGKAQQEFEQLDSLHGNGGVSPPGSSHVNHFHASKTLRPSSAVLEGLEDLCRDSRNVVFVVSGRGKEELEQAFGHIKGLGLAAEYGSFFRWPAKHDLIDEKGRGSFSSTAEQAWWEDLHPGLNNCWKAVTRRFMQDFQIHTHGSFIEEKGTAMLWHYGDADPEFGALQAQRLQDELADVLCGGSRASTTAVEGVLGWGAVEGTSGAHWVTKSRFCCESAVRSSLSLGGASTDSIQARSEAGLIEITHEEGRNRDVGGVGAYLEVRARGASKGRFVHMVLSKLGWSPGGGQEGTAQKAPGSRFCLCVGDDVSDEDMFRALKSYGPGGNINESPTQPNYGRSLGWQQACKDNLTPGSKEKPPQSLITVTVGSKPSEADAWLPGVDAVVSLLRTLARVPSMRDPHLARTPFPSINNDTVATSASHPAIHSAIVPPEEDVETGGRSTPPARTMRAFSHGNHVPGGGQPVGLGGVMEGTVLGGIGGDVWHSVGVCVGIGGVMEGRSDMDVGSGVPVVRRHSYTMGGKPRISLSLTEFLRAVAQPEPEPPMF